MKKLLTILTLAALVSPSLVFAASDDVTLTSSVDIIAGGHPLDVVGDSNTIESIVVNADSFTITLQDTSKLKVSSPSFKEISHTAASANVVTSACESNDSHVEFTATAETIITVTPKSIVCGAGTTGGSSGSSGGGGGGGSATVAATPAAIVAVTAVATREAQIASIMSAIAALQAQINVMLQGGASVGQNASITANLSEGSQGPSVIALQQFLNTHGFAVAASGPGSPGNETEMFGSLTLQAVQKFQEQYGIASPGVPGYGHAGPKTRAKIAELSAN